MANISRSRFLRLAVVGAGTVAFAQWAVAQSNTDKSGQHMHGGTQPGPGTHGHSSSSKAGETKDIQDRQHNLPATPPHSSGSQK